MITIDGIIFTLQKHGGISVYFNELLKHMALSEVTSKLLIDEPIIQNLNTFSKNIDTNLRPSRLLERYRSCRVDSNATVFHSSYYRQPSRKNVPTVVTVHDFIYERYRSGPALLAHTSQKHASIRQAQSIICISESTRDDLIKFVGVKSSQQIHVIPNGVSTSFYPVSITQPECPFILFIGERRGYKNFSLVLAGLSQIPEIELLCVGGGPLKEDEFSTTKPDVRRRVKHLGYVSDEILNDLYNQAVCLVYPSRYEGFGIPVVEAMKAGCPVISVNCKAVVEVGGPALERLDEEDPEALAQAVFRLSEPSYRERRVIEGLERAKIYDWGRCHEQTLAVYRSMMI